MKYLYIKGDINDADFVTSMYPIKDWDNYQSEYNDILNIIKIVSDKSKEIRHNWPDRGEFNQRDESLGNTYKGLLTEEQIEHLREYLPSGENCGIHTIHQISIIDVTSREDLLIIDRAQTDFNEVSIR